MVARKGYKLTEIGEIPEDWEVIPWDNALSIVSGQVDPKASPYCDMILVAPDHIESESGRILKKETAKDQNAISGKYIFLKGDIVYSKIRPHLRKVYCPDFDGICSADMYPLRARQGFIHTLLFYILLGDIFSRFAESISARSGIPKINRRELSTYIFALPPTTDEQTAIATALSDADALIDALAQCIAKKRHIKQGAMQELLTGKRRLSGFEGEWEEKMLGKLAKIQRGASPRPIDSPIWFDLNSSVGWVRISDVTSADMYLRYTKQMLSQLGVQQSRFVEKNNLIMSICATVGRPIVTAIDVCIHDGFVVFDEIDADKMFLYFVLKWLESTWTKHGQTGSQMNLNTGLINTTRVVVPPTHDEQTAIAAVLTDMDDEIAALEAKLSKARQIKAGMMQELLTGRTRLI